MTIHLLNIVYRTTNLIYWCAKLIQEKYLNEYIKINKNKSYSTQQYNPHAQKKKKYGIWRVMKQVVLRLI